MDPTLLAVILGAVIGLVLALTGAGGGVLAIPLLVFGLHLPVQQAAPVGLVAVGLAAALGAALGLKEGIVRYRAAALIGAAGMLVAPLGVWLAQHLPNRPLLGAFSLARSSGDRANVQGDHTGGDGRGGAAGAFSPGFCGRRVPGRTGSHGDGRRTAGSRGGAGTAAASAAAADHQ